MRTRPAYRIFDRAGAARRIRVSFLPELDGGGMTFGQTYVDVVRGRTGKVGHLFEFCAGPGFIGFSLLAEGLCERLTLSDINPAAVEACRETVRANRLEGCVAVYQSDGLDGIPADVKWDLVVSNPPHFPGTERQYRENIRLIDPGFAIHRRFYRDVGSHLSDGGAVIIQENGHGSALEDFAAMIEEGGLEVVEVFPKAGRWKTLLPRRLREVPYRVAHAVMGPLERLLLVPTVERAIKDNAIYRRIQRLPVLTPSPYYFVWSRARQR